MYRILIQQNQIDSNIKQRTIFVSDFHRTPSSIRLPPLLYQLLSISNLDRKYCACGQTIRFDHRVRVQRFDPTGSGRFPREALHKGVGGGISSTILRTRSESDPRQSRFEPRDPLPAKHPSVSSSTSICVFFSLLDVLTSGNWIGKNPISGTLLFS